MTDLSDHEADPGDHDGPIQRSRCFDLGDRDGPAHAANSLSTQPRAHRAGLLTFFGCGIKSC